MRIFFIKKDSLTLSQQVSPRRRHCAGSLQAFYDKRPKVGHIQTQNSNTTDNNIYCNRDNQSLVGYVTWTEEDMEATSQNEQVFLSKKIPSHFLSRLAQEDTALAPSRIEYGGDFLE